MSRLIAMTWLFICGFVSGAVPAVAQEIKVNPKGVNVNSQGATSVFLTFGGLVNYRPAESTWCGALVEADPDLGFKCDPATVYGSLPARYNQSRRSGNGAYTDIMSIPSSVARRAYQAAASGEESRFFYVRRFTSTTGGPDQYVDVTCRLTGGGARVPFSLTDVRLSFGTETLVPFINPGDGPPPIKAEISYTGTGRLKGRWEIVMPGDELPGTRDLLTEATLPVEERGLQRRYTELNRFNAFLPPVGRFILPGPDPARLPNRVEGQYLILLRIEATDDREADSNLAAVGAGEGVAHSGGVAGFPLPVLRYVVGGSNSSSAHAATPTAGAASTLALLLPVEDQTLPPNLPVDFMWTGVARAAFYRLEVETPDGKMILSAMLPSGVTRYRAPSWLKEKVEGGALRWRVLALDQVGVQVDETPRRTLRLAPAK